MDILNIDSYKFITYSFNGVETFFSTAEGGLDFNKSTEVGKKNLEKLKEWFSLKEICFLNQTHSDDIYIYDGRVHDGDGLITEKKNIGIGIFTADCVPVLIYDDSKEVIAAVHSGWKGTLNKIVLKTIKRMINEYSSNPEQIAVFIGPHNRACCYEIGKEVADQFLNDEDYCSIGAVVNNKLNLEKCIETQLLKIGVKKNNIFSTGICTYCSDEFKLHSYRKKKETSGRMFSFIYL